MAQWEFSRRIDAGTVISTVLLVAAIVTAYARLSERIAALETKVEPFWVQVLTRGGK